MTSVDSHHAPDRPSSIGLIGGGGISETHARAVSACPDAALVAAQGRNPDRSRAASPVVSDVGAFAAAGAGFLEAVRTARSPVCSGRDGRETLAVVEVVYADAVRR